MREKGLILCEDLYWASLNQTPDVWPAVPIDASLPCKSVTRRVIVPQPSGGIDGCYHRPDGKYVWLVCGGDQRSSNDAGGPGVGVGLPFCSPYAPVGTRLYLLEPYHIVWGCKQDRIVRGWYQRDYQPFSVTLTEREYDLWTARKKPYMRTSGRFMYRSLARHWFEVKSVRAERVQEITEDDSRREGIPEPMIDEPCRYSHFAMLWDTINAGRGYPWDSNPWVWRVEYGRVSA